MQAHFYLVIAASALVSLTSAQAENEIVLAIRYLQPEGTSHAHLYLYREDGKFLRQLTNDNSGQDVAPIFSSDGATIVFTREKPHKVLEYWSVQPRGGGLKKLDAAPQWYADAKPSPFFTNAEPPPEPSPGASASPNESPTPAAAYTSPDGTVELVLREDPNDPDDRYDMPPHGKHYLVRDLATHTETPFGQLPGFEGAYGILQDKQDPNRRFLFEGTLRLAFFELHFDSTEGTAVYALDLNKKRLVRLSPNWATPFPLPGESAFLTLAENRYVPIPGSSKTANCSYVERWDENLNHLRYAREKTAAICYGFSAYRPGKDPAVITMAGSSQTER